MTSPVRHRHDLVTARDGVRLATDVYLPGGPGPVPAVLQRTPYGKLGADTVAYAEWCAARGYACVAQDVRGRHDSDGEWKPYGAQEIPDAFDTLEWIARQPWSSGAVACVGSSYGAFAGFMAALGGHPALRAIVARVPASGLYRHHFYHGGVFSLARLLWGTLVNRRVQQEAQTAPAPRSVFETLIGEDPGILLHLPVADLGDRFAMRVPWWRTWVEHEAEDEYWRSQAVIHQFERVRVPVFHVGGWHDDFVSVPLANFSAARAAHPTAPPGFHRLLMGMWPHALNQRRDYGGLDYGPEAVIPLWEQEQQWLDRWLLDRGEGPAEPPVRLFVMWPNTWRAYHEWPPETTEPRELFLGAGGRLSFAPPGAEPPDGFRYDPRAPTPQPWDFGEWDLPILPRWPLDPRPRADRLLYASERLAEPLAVIGPVVLRLHAATSARDTDWFGWVAWEDPATGRVRLLTYGACLRARFRHGFGRPRLLEPGAVVRYEIDLGATARVLPRGARLLCCVQSSCVPWYARNLNTGGNNHLETDVAVAEQTIYHDRQRPSAVVLRVEPDRRAPRRS